MADAIGDQLDGMGIVAPHLVGNSLGGWVALELAGRRPVASLTLLGPAGLWCGRTPPYNLLSLRATRWAAQHGGAVLRGLVRFRLGRILVLGQTHGRPTRLSADQARATIRTLAGCPGFEAALGATVRSKGAPDGRDHNLRQHPSARLPLASSQVETHGVPLLERDNQLAALGEYREQARAGVLELTAVRLRLLDEAPHARPPT